MMLHDEHLTQALRHAPDRAISPSVESRAAILEYARQSLAAPKKSLYVTLQEWWRSWHVANWQLASAGGVFAAVLVLVVFWHGQPKDSEWVDATPAHIAAVESAVADSAADATAQDNNQFKSDQPIESDHIDNQLLKDRLPEVAARAESIPQQTERALSAMPSTPAAVSEDAVSVTALAKKKSKAEIVALPAEPVFKKSAPPAAKPSLTQGAEKLVTGAEVESIVPAQIHEKRSAIGGGAQSKRKTGLPGDVSSGAALAEAIGKEGGQEVARRDIEAGVLRHLYLEEALPSQSTQACIPSQSNAVGRLDSVTGYRVEVISGCYSSATLMKEVEIYNQTLRDWYVKTGK